MRLIPVTDPAELAILNAQLEEDFIQQEALNDDSYLNDPEYLAQFPYKTDDDVPF